MLRFLRLFVIGLIGLALLLIAFANRSAVEVRLLPPDIAALVGRDLSTSLPLFLVLFGGIVLGLLIGFVWEWLRESKHRSTASQKSREVARLERELAVLKDSSSAGPRDEILDLIERPATR
jgi:lipopolysaccharide assembly protein A